MSSDRDAMAKVAVSISIVFFVIDGISMVSPPVWSIKSHMHHIDIGVVVGGDSDWWQRASSLPPLICKKEES